MTDYIVTVDVKATLTIPITGAASAEDAELYAEGSAMAFLGFVPDPDVPDDIAFTYDFPRVDVQPTGETA